MSLANPVFVDQARSASAGSEVGGHAERFVSISLEQGWRGSVLISTDGDPSSHGDHALSAEHWRTWFSKPLEWTERVDRQRVLKTSSTTLVCRISLPLDGVRSIDAVYKRGKPRRFRKRLLSLFRTSRPRRTWRRARALLRNGISTARPLAVFEQRRFGLLVDSVFVTEYLKSAVDLEYLLTVGMRSLTAEQAARLKRQLAGAVAGFIVRLSAAGFHHRDMKALNVIVQWEPTGGAPPRISLVDLDGLKRDWPSGRRNWMRMLMRLNVSADGFKRVTLTDRLRVLKCYLKLSGDPDMWRTVWREIADMSEKKRQRRDLQQQRSFEKYGRY